MTGTQADRIANALASCDATTGLTRPTTRGVSYGPAVEAVLDAIHTCPACGQSTNLVDHDDGCDLIESERHQDHQRACEQIAAMHAAAVGEVRGPIRGVVEDVADMRARMLAAEEALSNARKAARALHHRAETAEATLATVERLTDYAEQAHEAYGNARRFPTPAVPAASLRTTLDGDEQGDGCE